MRNLSKIMALALIVGASFWQVGCDKGATETVKPKPNSVSFEQFPAFATEVMQQLASEKGTILDELNKASKTEKTDAKPVIALANLKGKSQKMSSLPTIVTKSEGEVSEEVMLALTPLKRGANKFSAEETVLALSPDRVAVTSDAEGNTVYPVVTPGVKMSDGSSVEVSFDKDHNATVLGTNKTNAENVVILTDLAVDDGDSTSGETAVAGTPYFALAGLRLQNVFTADNDDANIQYFVDESDDYGRQFSQYMTGRFDSYSNDNYCDPSEHLVSFYTSTYIQTVDLNSSFKHNYESPDVNKRNVYCSFRNISVHKRSTIPIGSENTHTGCFYEGIAPHLPLLTLTSNPKRLILEEDDSWHARFSRNRRSSWEGDVATIDLDTGTYEKVKTKWNANWTISGSDQPILESGVRNIRSNAFYVTTRLLQGQAFGRDYEQHRYEFEGGYTQ